MKSFNSNWFEHLRRLVQLPDRFRLGWWFMAISLAVIATNSLLFAWILTGFLSKQMIERDAIVSMEYLNSIVKVQRATDYFHGEKMSAKVPEMEEFFLHVASLPDVIRANVYGEDRSILWSSNPEMIGKTFPYNEELEVAFTGAVDPELKTVQRDSKPEHVNFPPGVTEFIEYYAPIWAESGRRVVGTVEIYKSPTQLLGSIKMGQRYVWLGSLGAAIALYTGLALVAWYARQVLREQEARTIESERLAVVGEMASAVAHGLRNPLASIRSSAELALDDEVDERIRQPLHDIVEQSDRLERWIRSFLRQASSTEMQDARPMPIDNVIDECIAGFQPQLDARRISLSRLSEGGSPIVIAHSAELSQIFNSMIANSIEAIEHDGKIIIERSMNTDGVIKVEFIDSGPGFAPEILTHAFTAFATTKNSGVGVGLTLARRTVDRLGGKIALSNRDSSGARVTIELPATRLAS